MYNLIRDIPVDTMISRKLIIFVWFFGTVWCKRCEEITLPMCKGIGYNNTYMPNQFNHDTQEEAGLEVHHFWPLVVINCSPDLKFFLCSMYVPICIEDYHQALPACRSVCERARAGCSPLMRQYGFSWPERMVCEKFPDYGDPHNLCMDSRNGTEQPGYSPTTKQKFAPPSTGKTSYSPKHGGGTPRSTTHRSLVTKDPCGCDCVKPFVNLTSTNPFYNSSSIGAVKHCAMSCHNPFFNEDERTFATIWLGVWSVLCCVSSSLTVLTFLVDTQRFRYPEQPIVFMSACYVMVSAGYVVRLVLGHEQVACADATVINLDATSSVPCVVVFLLVYYFGMASSIWWVILSFTWFLASSLKWGNEAIASSAHYFHLIAWLVPFVKTLAILGSSAADGDPIGGICYVGNNNVQTLFGFVFVPLVLYFLLGVSFLLTGFISLFRIRSVIKKQASEKYDTKRRIEKLMLRIGMFSFLYAVPAVSVIICLMYELYFRLEWEKSYTCACEPARRPDFSFFMVKYFMGLVVGITTGIWIWSSKTVDSWRKVYRFCCCRRDPYLSQSVKTFDKSGNVSINCTNHLNAKQKNVSLTHV